MAVIVLRCFFLSCSIYLRGLRKPQNIFCVNSKLHIANLFKVICPYRSHLIFVKIYLTGSLCFYGFHGPNKPTILLNPFHTILSNSINKKQPSKQKPKAVKERRGGGKFDCGQRFNVFFLNLPKPLLQRK